MSKRKAAEITSTPLADRANAKLRGIHPDGIQAAISPSSRSKCVDCAKLIPEGSPRWGIKYAGNPLTGSGAGVIPLYGSHPMVMWCHPRCGLAFRRNRDIDGCDAARTCHLCSNAPDDAADEQIKLLCGGRAKGKKIQAHAFHIGCWKNSIQSSALEDEAKKSILDIDLSNVNGWDDLTAREQTLVLNCWED